MSFCPGRDMSGPAAIWCAARSRRQTRSATSLTPPTAATQLNTNLLAAGDPLAEAEREAEHGLAFAQKARFGFVVDCIATQLGLIRTLRGLTPTFGSFDDEQFDEARIERRFSENPDLAFVECWYWVRKLQARFFAGDYASAIEASSQGATAAVDIGIALRNGGISILRRAVSRRILRRRGSRTSGSST